MKLVVDTNVPKAANGSSASPQASPECITTCAQRLKDLQRHHILVLDDGWHILREYIGQLASSGQPSVGDAFLKWVLTNQTNSRRCEHIHITPSEPGPFPSSFLEFPSAPELADFHWKDRKFVAVAAAHPEHPPILNAVDSDWWDHREAMALHGIQIEFVCRDAPFIQGD